MKNSSVTLILLGVFAMPQHTFGDSAYDSFWKGVGSEVVRQIFDAPAPSAEHDSTERNAPTSTDNRTQLTFNDGLPLVDERPTRRYEFHGCAYGTGPSSATKNIKLYSDGDRKRLKFCPGNNGNSKEVTCKLSITNITENVRKYVPATDISGYVETGVPFCDKPLVFYDANVYVPSTMILASSPAEYFHLIPNKPIYLWYRFKIHQDAQNIAQLEVSWNAKVLPTESERHYSIIRGPIPLLEPDESRPSKENGSEPFE